MYDRGGQVEIGYSPWRTCRSGPIRGTRTPVETADPFRDDSILRHWFNPLLPERKDPMSTVTKQVASDLRAELARFTTVYGVVAYVRYVDGGRTFTNVTPVALHDEHLEGCEYIDRGAVEQYVSEARQAPGQTLSTATVPNEVRLGIEMVLDSVTGRRINPEPPQGEFLRRLAGIGLFPFEWGNLSSDEVGESILYWTVAAMPTKKVTA